MKKYIYTFCIILSSLLTSQDFKLSPNTQKSIDGKNIIKKYLKTIGGEKKIEKINTIIKEFTIEIDGLSNIYMKGEILYKEPNLYSSVLEIEEIGEIQSTKYDGQQCVIKRKNNNETIQKKIEGKMLKEKEQEFLPFPILQYKKNNAEFSMLEIQESNKRKIYKVSVKGDQKKEIILFFDAKDNLLIRKKIIDETKKETIDYQNYQKIEGIMFPFLEINTTTINNKIAQKSTKTISNIIINQQLSVDHFQE